MQDFDKIYAEYYSIVYKFVMGLCQSRETAEEITQEAFFKALKNIDSFKGNCKISTWLCQIAKNTFYSHAKKQIKNTVYRTGGVISDENIEKSFEDKDEAFLVLKVLHKLKEPYKVLQIFAAARGKALQHFAAVREKVLQIFAAARGKALQLLFIRYFN